MGLCKLKEKSYHDAIKYFNEAKSKEFNSDTNDKNPGIEDGLGTAMENLGEFEQALEHYEEAINT